MTERLINRRQQGDLGEASAIEWLTRAGAVVFTPIGHSPDVDLVALLDGRTLRVEVKTTGHRDGGCWSAAIATRGGNQSWQGVVKGFDRSRCEFLFVHVADGRRWMIPTPAVDGTTSINLGGPKYSEYEIEPGAAFTPLRSPFVECERYPGGVPKRSNGMRCKRIGSAFVGSNPASPTVVNPAPIRPTKYERKLGQLGQAVINQKRRLTIPQRPFFEAGFESGGRVRVRADGPGRLVVEQVERPAWADATGSE